MKPEDAHNRLIDFQNAAIPQGEVHITGGEPFLDFNYLLRILEGVSGTGYSGFGFVETNAFWAINDKICEDRLLKIKALGTQRVCISSDIFHQEFVPKENVLRLVDAAHKIIGLESVILRWPNGLKEEKHIGQMTPEQVQNYLFNPMRDFRVRLVGRASNKLDRYVPKYSADHFAQSPCFEKIFGSGHYHFDLNNNLVPGIGCLTMGNSVDGTLLQLIKSVNRQDNPFLHWLAEEGPSGEFLRYAKERGYPQVTGGYGDKCQLCYGIRKWLYKTKQATSELAAAEAYQG
jgi:hypothetical protein